MTQPATSQVGFTAPGNRPMPRLVFFRPLDDGLPDFIKGHLRDQERCLQLSFDVHVIHEDADYDAVCDRLQPDLALFESGVYVRQRRFISNTNTHPDIPKLGFLDADAYCPTRSAFLSDMEDWGVDTFFTLGVATASHTLSLAERLYAWPNFADRATFHTYPGGKSTSVLLTGSRRAHYPWRVAVTKLLAEHFPTRDVPHAGWFDAKSTAGMPMGESYARTLSESLVVPTCGTITNELVRKHFEIPASGAVLLTEDTGALRAAGFVDMVNCVFATEEDVVEKVDHLLRNPDELARIASAGQTLVHSRHSIEHRDQIRQWYELRRSMPPGSRIVQPDLFGPLETEPVPHEPRPVTFIAPPGRDGQLLLDGERLLSIGQPADAADRFASVLNYHFEPEAALGLARSWLRLGLPAEALGALTYAVKRSVLPVGASHPDPVEWAWLIRTHLCAGDTEGAWELATAYPTMTHPQLEWIRGVAGALCEVEYVSPAVRPRSTLHHGGEISDPQAWAAGLVADLTACGRAEFAVAADAWVHAHPDGPRVDSSVAGPDRGRPPALLRRRTIRRRVADELRRRVLKPAPPQAPPTLIELLGEQVASVVGVGVSDPLANRLAEVVAGEPGATTMVRLGRASPEAGTGFSPWALRSGVERGILAELPRWGSSVVVAGRVGAMLLAPEDLTRCRFLVLVGTEDPPSALVDTLSWSAASGPTVARMAEALGVPSLRMWERTESPVSREPIENGDNSHA